ncbi:MAG TPA: N-6 DNA methylase [Bacteroidia bacterium]|nr:N-6 DNA methylase [Bacteroidia bacterium]
MSEDNNSSQNFFNTIRSIRSLAHIYATNSVLLFFFYLKRLGLINDKLLSSKSQLKFNLHKAIQNSYNSDRILYSELQILYKLNEENINNIPEAILNQILGNIVNLEDRADNLIIKNNVEQLISSMVSTNDREIGLSFMPSEVTKLMCQLSEAKSGDYVYNPYAGLGSLGAYLPQDIHFIGQELNKSTWALGFLRTTLGMNNPNYKFVQGDSIDDFGCFKYINENPYKFKNWNQNKLYSHIISCPPFGLKTAYSGKNGEIISVSSEFHLIESGIKLLSNNGKLIACISNGFLFRQGKEAELRKYLVENDLIETVISLPSNLLYNTAIPTSILLINQNKALKGKIKFIEGRQLISTEDLRLNVLDFERILNLSTSINDGEYLRIAPMELVALNEYNLMPSRYFQKFIPGEPLSNFCEILRFGRDEQSLTGKFIRIRDLKGDPADFRINTNSIAEIKLPSYAVKINKSCLLVSTNWKSLKPTYFNYEGTPLFSGNDIIAITFDENKVNLGFLIEELSSKSILEQIDLLTTGTTVPRLSKQDLLNLKLVLPPLAEQNAKFMGFIAGVAELKKRELESFAKINGLENELYEQNTFLRHKLAGPVSNALGAFENIFSILNSEVVSKLPDVMNFKLTSNHLYSLNDYINILKKGLDDISDSVKKKITFDINFANKVKSPIDILAFINAYVKIKKENPTLNYSIDVKYDSPGFLDENTETESIIYVNGNEELLTDLFDNLLENAQVHAFTQGANNRIEFYIIPYIVNEDKPEICILVSNNGKPFPDDDDLVFSKNGSKAGPNSGDGFGGYYVSEIIKFHDGKWDIIDETGPEGLPNTDLATTIDITLPVISSDAKI